MTSPDLDELAALWQSDPDPAEQEGMESLASRARRRGRLLGYADVVLALLIVGGTLFGAFVAQGPVTIVAALLLAFGTIWLTFKLRAARRMSRTLDTRDRESFIESSVSNIRSDLRRYTLGLIFVPVLVPIVIIWKVSLRNGGRIPDPAETMLDWAQSTRGIITMCLMAAVALVVLRSRRKLQRELRQLEQLRSAYRDEGEKDEAPDRSTD